MTTCRVHVESPAPYARGLSHTAPWELAILVNRGAWGLEMCRTLVTEGVWLWKIDGQPGFDWLDDPCWWVFFRGCGDGLGCWVLFDEFGFDVRMDLRRVKGWLCWSLMSFGVVLKVNDSNVQWEDWFMGLFVRKHFL